MMTMLLSWLHALAAQPFVYDKIQDFFGARQLREKLSRHIQIRGRDQYVIDFGGGTGAMRNFLPPGCRYVCLDVDQLKLRGFLSGYRQGMAVLGSASFAPFRDGCADYVLVVSLCHHLDDDALEDTFREVRRVLKPDGLLVLLDPVLAPHRPTSRMLWALDRGSYPRLPEYLVARLGRHMRILEEAHPAIYHEYLIIVSKK